MKVAVIGGRDFNDYDKLKEVLGFFPISVVVSGGAIGADTLGEKYADENGISKEIYVPQWDLFGKKAGFMRNTTIVENSDIVIAFWDSKSRGTRDSIEKANKLRKSTFIIYY
jgi:hypothetical protein